MEQGMFVQKYSGMPAGYPAIMEGGIRQAGMVLRLRSSMKMLFFILDRMKNTGQKFWFPYATNQPVIG